MPDIVANSFKNGQYRTVMAKEDLTVYRLFGEKAKLNGSFATTTPAQNRIQSKIDSALLPEWKNTRKYEAKIVVPKGTKLEIGRVEKQFTKSGTKFEGNADQILLPENGFKMG